MHELLTAAEMAEADRRTIAGGTPGMTLMEAAGRAVAAVTAALVPEGPVVVVAGTGNNGGDGFVAARLLSEGGRPVTVLLLGDPARLAGDALTARQRWTGPTRAAALPLPPAAVIVDALFGAGLDRPVTGEAAALVAAMNAAPAPVVAVDLPSGVPADTGAPLGIAVEAAATATFFRLKPAHLLYPGRALCGRVTCADIGIPAAVLDAIGPQAFENTPALWDARLARPEARGHKFDRGHAVVVSGGMTRTGAARLAAGAALRAGAGLVTLASPPEALAVNAAHLTAVMLRRLDGPASLAAMLDDLRVSVVALGPALGTGAAERALLDAALAAPPAAVLDADAITLAAAAPAEVFAAIARREAPVDPHAARGRVPPPLPGPRRARPPGGDPRRRCAFGGRRDPQGPRHHHRRAGRPPRDQRQRTAVAGDGRLGRCPRRHRRRASRPAHARLRGRLRGGLAPRGRRRRGRTGAHRRGSRTRAPPGHRPAHRLRALSTPAA